MEEFEYWELLSLSVNRKEEYQSFSDVLEYVMTDRDVDKWVRQTYLELLGELLKTDALINVKLYQIACLPHLKGKYADHSTVAETYKQLLASVDYQDKNKDEDKDKNKNEYLSEVKPEISRTLLLMLQQRRDEQLFAMREIVTFNDFLQLQKTE